MSETRSGYRQSVGGLLGAIIACLGLIVVIWLLARFQGAGGDDVEPAPTVDYTQQLATARDQASFDVLAPSPAPRGWRATSAEWQAAGPIESWHLGFLTAAEEYVGLEQSNALTDDVVIEATPADQPGAPVAIDGDPWQTLTSGDGTETALVYVEDDVTTVVTGTAPKDQLVDFAALLSSD